MHTQKLLNFEMHLFEMQDKKKSIGGKISQNGLKTTRVSIFFFTV